MADKTLEFETPHFLHGLFADDLSLLKELEERLGVTVTTRDSWIRFEGEPERVELGASVISDLEEARRQGGTINAHSFRYALGAAAERIAERADEPGMKVADLFRYRLLGSGSKPAVTPRTANQLAYVEALDHHDVVFGIGPAGTGKTFLAMAYALDLLKSRQIDRIILTRPAVEAGEALGFLPGALEEKVLPYLRPLYDAMNEMLDGAESLRFAEKNLIEIAPLAYMRGRTLHRACVILDEAQNASREQMFMCLTRMGEHSKCIVTGDPSQIDLRPKSRSGLLEAIELLDGIEGVAFVHFEGKDVVRHPVVARIIEAYKRGRGEKGEMA
jgi:phosphate starvation-inducible PhoH-like protein